MGCRRAMKTVAPKTSFINRPSILPEDWWPFFYFNEENNMIPQLKPNPLLDHVDMRMVAERRRDPRSQCDLKSPAFATRISRARNAIAQIAMTYKPGSPIPSAPPYTELEHGVWQTIWKALGPAHREHACAEYLDCLDQLAFDTDRIPQLDEVSQKVEAISGFRLEPVAGLVEPRVFLESLARGVFLCRRSTFVITRRPCTRRNRMWLTK